MCHAPTHAAGLTQMLDYYAGNSMDESDSSSMGGGANGGGGSGVGLRTGEMQVRVCVCVGVCVCVWAGRGGLGVRQALRRTMVVVSKGTQVLAVPRAPATMYLRIHASLHTHTHTHARAHTHTHAHAPWCAACAAG
jgi:hypothetical protein